MHHHQTQDVSKYNNKSAPKKGCFMFYFVALWELFQKSLTSSSLGPTIEVKRDVFFCDLQSIRWVCDLTTLHTASGSKTHSPHVSAPSPTNEARKADSPTGCKHSWECRTGVIRPSVGRPGCTERGPQAHTSVTTGRPRPPCVVWTGAVPEVLACTGAWWSRKE